MCRCTSAWMTDWARSASGTRGAPVTDTTTPTDRYRYAFPDAFAGLTARQADILADTLTLGTQRGTSVSTATARDIAAKIRGLLAD